MSAMEPIDAREFPLDHEPIEDWQTIGAAASAGVPETARALPESGTSVTTGYVDLGTIAGAEYGLWEMSVGAMRDIEGEEVFLVVSGTGRIEVDEPSRTSIVLAPGSLVRLEGGMKTRWFIGEKPLRKLYIAPSGD